MYTTTRVVPLLDFLSLLLAYCRTDRQFVPQTPSFELMLRLLSPVAGRANVQDIRSGQNAFRPNKRHWLAAQ